MKIDKTLYPELSQEGIQDLQKLMDKFEKNLNEFATDLIRNTTRDFYCNISPFIESDHWTNYRSQILSKLMDYGNEEVGKDERDKIRRAIYRNHKEEIVKDLNQDLLKEIQDLKNELSRIISR